MLVFSILTPFEHALRHVLNVIVRMILVPLTVRQLHSMQNMQRHAPEMKAIQQKYKHDKQKQNEELMKFYREKGINPASSCLPLVAQFPVFIALYYTLRSFARHPPSGDLSWLHFIPSIAAHTTTHWGGYVLLVIYVASQMASTLYMSATVDKMQRYLFMLMPVVFVFIIARFPAGLVLYWVTTNLWTVGQGLITRRLLPKTPAPSPFTRSSRTPPKSDDGGGGNGAKRKPEPPKPAPAAQAKRPVQPQPVRRKKKARR
jgi:YidC/Oxa1 family membrane protein insertase